MKFLTFGETSLIRSAFASKTDAGLEVVVNLQTRECVVHVQGGSTFYHPDCLALDYDTYVVTKESEPTGPEDAPEAELVIICETPEEHQMMSDALRYESYCKDQFSVLYVPRSALQERASLGAFPA